MRMSALTTRAKVAILAASLSLLTLFVLASIRESGDGLDWIRQYRCGELVTTKFVIDGQIGKRHEFTFEEIPDELVAKIKEKLIDGVATESEASGRISPERTLSMTRHEGKIYVSDQRRNLTWLERQWKSLKQALGLEHRRTEIY